MFGLFKKKPDPIRAFTTKMFGPLALIGAIAETVAAYTNGVKVTCLVSSDHGYFE